MILNHGINSLNTSGVDEVEILGKKYKYGKIGNKYWLLENFDHKVGSRFNTVLQDTNMQYSYCCYYGLGDESIYGKNGLNYGLLYNPFGVQDIESAITNTGWRVPTSDDFNDLIELAGGYSVAGYHLKSDDKKEWQSGLNEFGFNVRYLGRVSGSSYISAYFDQYVTGFFAKYESWQKQPSFKFDSNNYVQTEQSYYNSAYYVRLVKDI